MLKKQIILDVLVTILLLVTIFDPANQIFRIKSIIFFGVILTYILINYKRKMDFRLVILILGISLLLPQLSIFIGSILNSTFDIRIGKDLLKSYMYFFVSLVLIENVEKYKSILNKCMLGVVIIVLITNISLLFDREIFSLIYSYSLEKQNMMIANRQFGKISLFSIYYKTIILAIVPLSFYFREFLFSPYKKIKNFVLTFLFSYGIFISGTRANLICLAFIVFSLLLYYSIKRKKGFLLIMIIILFLASSNVILKNFFDREEQSNTVKLGHYISYKEEFNKMNLLFGHGAGTKFYSKGINQYTDITELTYMELFRRMGMIGFTFYMLFLLYPLFKLRKRIDIIVWYSIYILAAGTNPLLFSSTGMLLMAFVYAEIFKKEVVEYECKSTSTYVNL